MYISRANRLLSVPFWRWTFVFCILSLLGLRASTVRAQDVSVPLGSPITSAQTTAIINPLVILPLNPTLCTDITVVSGSATQQATSAPQHVVQGSSVILPVAPPALSPTIGPPATTPTTAPTTISPAPTQPALSPTIIVNGVVLPNTASDWLERTLCYPATPSASQKSIQPNEGTPVSAPATANVIAGSTSSTNDVKTLSANSTTLPAKSANTHESASATAQPATDQPSPAQRTSPQPTVVQQTTIQPAPVTPTAAQPTPPQPSTVPPTAAQLTPVPPTAAQPTPVKPPQPASPASAPADLEALFQKHAATYGVDAEIMKKIASCESGMRPEAVNGPYGGMFQFVTSTWVANRKAMGKDPDPALRFNAAEAIETAAFKMGHDGYGAWPVCGRKALASR